MHPHPPTGLPVTTVVAAVPPMPRSHESLKSCGTDTSLIGTRYPSHRCPLDMGADNRQSNHHRSCFPSRHSDGGLAQGRCGSTACANSQHRQRGARQPQSPVYATQGPQSDREHMAEVHPASAASGVSRPAVPLSPAYPVVPATGRPVVSATDGTAERRALWASAGLRRRWWRPETAAAQLESA